MPARRKGRPVRAMPPSTCELVFEHRVIAAGPRLYVVPSPNVRVPDGALRFVVPSALPLSVGALAPGAGIPRTKGAR